MIKATLRLMAGTLLSPPMPPTTYSRHRQCGRDTDPRLQRHVVIGTRPPVRGWPCTMPPPRARHTNPSWVGRHPWAVRDARLRLLWFELHGRSGRLISNGYRTDSRTFDAPPNGYPPVPTRQGVADHAFGRASNHRSTSARRQPTARDPRPPSRTGAGKSQARTRRHNEVRDRPISASTAGVRKIK